jgi:hypothetical protein
MKSLHGLTLDQYLRRYGVLPRIAGAENPPPPVQPKKPDDADPAELQSIIERQKTELGRKDGALRRLKTEQDKTSRVLSLLLETMELDIPDDENEQVAYFERLKNERLDQKRGKTFPQAEVERQLAVQKDKFEQEKAKMQKEIDLLFKEMRKDRVDAQVAIAAGEHGATPGGAEAIALLIGREAEVVKEDDGTFKTVIKGPDGPKMNSTGAHMSIKERVAEIAADDKYTSFFRGPVSPGAGSRPGQQPLNVPSGRKKVTAAEMDSMTQQEWEEMNKKIEKGEVTLTS